MTTITDNNETACRVLAYDKHQQMYLGAIADISPDRLVLLSDTPIQAGLIMELQLQCAEQRPGLDGVYLGTQVLWCDAQDQTYWAGLQIISAEPQVRVRLSQLRAMAAMEDDPGTSSLTA